VACGSGLELIYEFLLTDEPGNRAGVQLGAVHKKVGPGCYHWQNEPSMSWAGKGRVDQRRPCVPAACVIACAVQTAAEISHAALEGSDPLAAEAVDMMMAIVGAEAGAMALRCLARGGRAGREYEPVHCVSHRSR
jgi:glucokinase